jgi:hypothetical protein
MVKVGVSKPRLQFPLARLGVRGDKGRAGMAEVMKADWRQLRRRLIGFCSSPVPSPSPRSASLVFARACARMHAR